MAESLATCWHFCAMRCSHRQACIGSCGIEHATAVGGSTAKQFTSIICFGPWMRIRVLGYRTSEADFPIAASISLVSLNQAASLYLTSGDISASLYLTSGEPSAFQALSYNVMTHILASEAAQL